MISSAAQKYPSGTVAGWVPQEADSEIDFSLQGIIRVLLGSALWERRTRGSTEQKEVSSCCEGTRTTSTDPCEEFYRVDDPAWLWPTRMKRLGCCNF